MTLTHTREMEVEWGHCDPAGIVFHPRYFEWFDACAAALLDLATGEPKAATLRRYGIVGIPVVEAGANFHAPCRHGDLVSIVTTIADVGRSSFKLRHALRHGATLAVEGWSTRVWAGPHPDDPARIRAVPLPPGLAARFAS